MARSEARIPVGLPLAVKLGGDDARYVDTKNISERGLLFEADYRVAPGTAVELTVFDGTTGSAIELEGFVAHSTRALLVSSTTVGVELLAPPGEWFALCRRVAAHFGAPPVSETVRVVRNRRMRVVVVGGAALKRGALALYVTSGFDVRVTYDLADARAILSGAEVGAILIEADVGIEMKRELLALAAKLQPQARRIVRSFGEGSGPISLTPDGCEIVAPDAPIETIIETLARSNGADSDQVR